MKKLSPIALAFLALLLTSAAADEEWQTLFNGSDLNGWRANVDPQSFTVVNGAIRAHATGEKKSHLFFVGGSKDEPVRFKNFVLELSVRGEPNSNSGVFFHTDKSTRDDALHLAKGYEVQINSSPREKRKTGSLYDVVDLEKSAVDESEWFHLRITVQGKRITVKINDAEVIDYTEPDDVQRPPKRAGRLIDPEGGAIALQGHDPNSIVYFKDIRIKPLP